MKKIILLFILFFCCLNVYLNAQPGQLDPLFGIKGVVTADLGFRINQPVSGKQVLVQSNGSIFILFETAQQSLIAKRLQNGSPDSSYGVNGFSVSVPVYSSHAAIQPDGKIVVVGTNWNNYDSYEDFSLARFNTDGTLDNSFDGDGKQTTDFGEFYENATSVAIGSNGKIIVVGNTSDETYSSNNSVLVSYDKNGNMETSAPVNFPAYSMSLQNDQKVIVAGDHEISRYNINGSIDNTFGINGIQSPDLIIASLALQSDGKIVVAGFISNGSDDDFAITRYNINGSTDNTFNGGNSQITDLGGEDYFNSISIQSNGKIVAAGSGVVRYNTDGSFDKSFSADGMQVTNFIITSVVAQIDGKILGAGTNGNDFAIACFNTNGNPDNTFDRDGNLTDNLHQGSTSYKSTAVQTDGKLVAAGSIWNGSNYDFAVVRYNLNGSLDKIFAGTGIQRTDFNSADNSANSLAIQQDGKLVVAGGNFIARYSTNGILDPAFSGDGKQTANFNINSIIIQTDGKIIAAGVNALVRYNIDGTPDNTFSTHGKQINDFTIASIAIQSDGKIVGAGQNGNDFAVARYNNDGSSDAKFGKQGMLTISNNSVYYQANSLAIQGDGKIVIAGFLNSGNRGDFDQCIIVRYTSNGIADESFGEHGRVITSFEKGDNFFSTVAIQSDGKIIAAGTSHSYKNDSVLANFALVRFNSDGSFDNSFNGNGKQVTSVSASGDGIQSIALFKGVLYAAGYGQYPANFGVVARYLFSEGGALPVSLVAFNAVLQNKSVLLQWKVATEKNLSTFVLERSGDGNSFSPIKNVTALGVSTFSRNYSATDDQPLQGINFYRLKMLEADGRFTLSNVVAVKINSNNKLQVFPNPVQKTLYVQADGNNDNATFQIVDAVGRKVKEIKVFINGKTSFSFDVNSLPKGTYNLILFKNEKTEIQKFIKE